MALFHVFPRVSLALVWALLPAGCAAPLPDATADAQAIVHPIRVWEVGDDRAMAPVTIKAAAIEGDRLRLTLEYPGSGGSDGRHEFRLLRSASFAQSQPPQIDLYLSHASSDAREQAMQAVVHFDLSGLKQACLRQYPDAGALVLRIHDTEDEAFMPPPRYSFGISEQRSVSERMPRDFRGARASAR